MPQLFIGSTDLNFALLFTGSIAGKLFGKPGRDYRRNYQEEFRANDRDNRS